MKKLDHIIKFRFTFQIRYFDVIRTNLQLMNNKLLDAK